MIKLTLKYDFNDDDYEYEVKVDADDYADYLFDEVLSVKYTKEAYAAVVEMIKELDLYDAIEYYGFIGWLTEKYREDAQDQYETDCEPNDDRRY